MVAVQQSSLRFISAPAVDSVASPSSAASPTAALSLTPEEHAVGTPLADALQLLPQPLYVNQTLSRVLLHIDMLVQVAVVKQPVELRSGLVSKPSFSLANRLNSI